MNSGWGTGGRRLARRLATVTLLTGMAVITSWTSGVQAQAAAPTVQTWSTTPSAPPLPPSVGQTGLGTAGAPVESASRLGRVAAVFGGAQIWDAQSGQWMPLDLNRPVTAGDRIRTEREARVELQIGSLALFLGPSSDLDFSQLDDAGVQARLQLGHLVARVRTVQWARDLVMLSPELQLRPSGPGLFRVDRDAVSGGRSAAAAIRGPMTVVGAGSRIDLTSGQRLEVLGPSAGGTVRRTTLLQDDFAAWVATRDAMPDAPVAPVAAALPEITGLDLLDRHGRWESHPDIGWVWMPLTVSPAWQPFRDGRWVWVRPWGWTWIDDTPWGFAPSNYGHWVQWRSRWVWAPSPIRHRPVPGPGFGIHPPRIPHPDQRHGGEWRSDGDERRMRIPRVVPGAGEAPQPAYSAQPALPVAGDTPMRTLPPVQAAPPAQAIQPVQPLLPPRAGSPIMVPGDGVQRALPDRRHGFERREMAPPAIQDRGERLNRPAPPMDRPERQERPDRGERGREVLQ